MIGLVRRALDGRREVRETVERLVAGMGAGAWKHARERASAAPTPQERAKWRKVQARIEALDDRTARMSLRKSARRART